MARTTKKEFKSEQEAIAYFQSRGWEINSYHGANGITFTHHGMPSHYRQVSRYADGIWRVCAGTRAI